MIKHTFLLITYLIFCELSICQTRIGNLSYQLSETEAEVTVLGNGSFYKGSINIPAKIDHEGKEYDVTSIGDWAFEGCNELASITIPHSIKTIGAGAFRDCKLLKTVIIPNSVYHINDGAFMNCRSLTSVIIPESMIAIGTAAFADCNNVQLVMLPWNLKEPGSIADHDFAGCDQLKMICINGKYPPKIIFPEVFGKINTAGIKLIVPEIAINDYKIAAVWKDFDIVPFSSQQECIAIVNIESVDKKMKNEAANTLLQRIRFFYGLKYKDYEPESAWDGDRLRIKVPVDNDIVHLLTLPGHVRLYETVDDPVKDISVNYNSLILNNQMIDSITAYNELSHRNLIRIKLKPEYFSLLEKATKDNINKFFAYKVDENILPFVKIGAVIADGVINMSYSTFDYRTGFPRTDMINFNTMLTIISNPLPCKTSIYQIKL